MMEYKGFIGEVQFDSDAHIFHGEVINTRDVITFQGKSVSELESAFKDSIEDYISWCKEDGVHPERLPGESASSRRGVPRTPLANQSQPQRDKADCGHWGIGRI